MQRTVFTATNTRLHLLLLRLLHAGLPTAGLRSAAGAGSTCRAARPLLAFAAAPGTLAHKHPA
jgi:hypothetical protein